MQKEERVSTSCKRPFKILYRRKLCNDEQRYKMGKIFSFSSRLENKGGPIIHYSKDRSEVILNTKRNKVITPTNGIQNFN